MEALAALSGRFTLVIDAGHGGKDSGAKGKYSLEKNINLKVALAFGRYVENNCPDVKVIYTRKKDVFVPLHERANIANKNHADVFISIHTNAIEGSRSIRGFETYTMGMRRADEKLSAAQRENSVITIEDNYQQRYAGYDPSSPESEIMFEFINDKNMEQSVRLAKQVQQNVCSIAKRQNKGVKQDVFLVLRETSMPACLIELGYITTPDEERALNNEETIDRIAYGIYSAFVKYKDKNKVTVPPYISPVAKSDPERESVKALDDKHTQDKFSDERRKTAEEKDLVVKDRDKAVEKKHESPASERKVKERNEYATQENRESSENCDRVAEAVESQEKVNAPVFKVQFMTGPRVLRQGSKEFKGLKNVGHYKEGRTVKFTVGEFSNFHEARSYRKEIVKLFPSAFVVAFQDGRRIDINEARNWR